MDQNSTVTALHVSGNNASETTLKLLKQSIQRNRKSNHMDDGQINHNNTTMNANFESKDESKVGRSTGDNMTENMIQTPLDPESLEGATSIIQTLEKALQLQRVELLSMKNKLESETIAHTRALEKISAMTVESSSTEERKETRILELKNEVSKHIRDRSSLIEQHNKKLEEIHLTNTSIVRTNYDLENKIRALNEQLSNQREELRKERLKSKFLW
jgi:hypothetical protein